MSFYIHVVSGSEEPLHEISMALQSALHLLGPLHPPTTIIGATISSLYSRPVDHNAVAHTVMKTRSIRPGPADSALHGWITHPSVMPDVSSMWVSEVCTWLACPLMYSDIILPHLAFFAALSLCS